MVRCSVSHAHLTFTPPKDLRVPQPPHSSKTFRSSKLMRDAMGRDLISPGSRLRIARPLDAESLIGRHEGSRPRVSTGASLSSNLQKRIGSSASIARAFGHKRGKSGAFPFDARQRAVVKLHYFGHAKGGAAALKQHARYIARDSAARAPGLTASRDDLEASECQGQENTAQAKQPAKARQEHWVFYDAARDSVSGARLAEEWAKQDKRHFRVILSAEHGGRIGDLRAYTRDVMVRAEAALGAKLQWFAVDHWDTDNPHTHIVLRGKHADGRDLIVPKEFVQHGFRNAARDAATARLGARGRGDERKALEREVIAHGPTRLDYLIANQLDERRQVRLAALQAPNGSPDMTDALKGRARELERLGLAREVKRNVLQFEPGWRDGLKAMELHLDIRKALMQARIKEQTRSLESATQQKPRTLRLPFGLGL